MTKVAHLSVTQVALPHQSNSRILCPISPFSSCIGYQLLQTALPLSSCCNEKIGNVGSDNHASQRHCCVGQQLIRMKKVTKYAPKAFLNMAFEHTLNGVFKSTKSFVTGFL